MDSAAPGGHHGPQPPRLTQTSGGAGGRVRPLLNPLLLLDRDMRLSPASSPPPPRLTQPSGEAGGRVRPVLNPLLLLDRDMLVGVAAGEGRADMLPCGLGVPEGVPPGVSMEALARPRSTWEEGEGEGGAVRGRGDPRLLMGGGVGGVGEEVSDE